LGPIALLRVLANNPLEAWTAAHFEQPAVTGGLTFGRVVVVNDPAAIRRVLLENCDNFRKDWLQRRVLSAGLTGGLLTAEGHQWKTQRRALAPLFARKTVMNFTPAMIDVANGIVARLSQREGQVVDIAVEATRVTLEVLEQTIFSEGFGRDPEEIRLAMKSYFEAIGRIDPFDILGVPDVVPRPARWKLRPMLRLFEDTIDTIIATRRERLAKDPASAPRDIRTLLLQSADPETGEALSETEVRANILTFIAAGHETTANCIAWSLFLLSQSDEWRERVQTEADQKLDDTSQGLSDSLNETRAVIDEANRLYPPITAISRAAIGRDELSGQAIKPGTMVVIAPYVLHRHRTLWDKPSRFDPNRFLGGRRQAAGGRRSTALPICRSAGPRVCIGATFAIQEASIVIATIMRHFTLQLSPGMWLGRCKKSRCGLKTACR
jgi:cytochrome P450